MFSRTNEDLALTDQLLGTASERVYELDYRQDRIAVSLLFTKIDKI